MYRQIFMDREKRDREYRRLQAQGVKVRKRSARGQVVSPEYIADYVGTPSPNGFGGSQAEFFAVLYMIEGRS
jgi:hypothetical protein